MVAHALLLKLAVVHAQTPTDEPTGKPTAVPSTAQPTAVPSTAPSYAPTEEGSIQFDLYLDLASWPYNTVDATIENYLLNEFADDTGVNANHLSLSYEFVPENRRLGTQPSNGRYLTNSWTLQITCTVTAPASSYSEITSSYTEALSTTSSSSFASGLNSACGCSDYDDTSIDSYSVESINDNDKSKENLALLSLLVLLVIPITLAFYCVKITYCPSNKSDGKGFNKLEKQVLLRSSSL